MRNGTKPLLLLILYLCRIAWAQEQIPERPNPPRLVNTFFIESQTFLSEAQQEKLNAKLVNFAKQTSNQICIVAIDELKGAEPAQYATWLIQKWGIGQKDKRNGVVVLVKLPSQNDPKRSLFIATGYGLEGAIPDLLTKKIRENEMLPYFKAGDFHTGLDKGTDALMKAAQGEYNDKVKSTPKSNTSSIVISLFIFIIIIAVFRSLMKGGGGNRGGGFTYYDGGFFNTWGGGSGGGGSSGGSGGWDFGGGDSGGGGSGGDW